MGGALGQYLHEEVMPGLEQALKKQDWEITPYVNVFNEPPEVGFSQFMDYPRYSTGYTTLFNTLGMMIETHMLKPYEKRVRGTYALMENMVTITETDHEKIARLRAEAVFRHQSWSHYPVQWEIDSTRVSTLQFKGYEADTLFSEATGQPRLKYDPNRPFTKSVAYQNYYRPVDSVAVPKAYILKKGYTKIANLLKRNRINYRVLQQDTLINVESYRIDTFETSDFPYEGHYPHENTQVDSGMKKMTFEQGDIWIPTDQEGIRYLLETLEPEARDSFFNWNFFDAILQRKENFSPYVFEDEAAQMLRERPDLRDSFQLKKENDEDFAANGYAQLDWLFKRSEHYEPAHMQYPVYRVLK